MTALQGIKSKPSRTKKGFSKKHTLTTCIPNVQVSIHESNNVIKPKKLNSLLWCC